MLNNTMNITTLSKDCTEQVRGYIHAMIWRDYYRKAYAVKLEKIQVSIDNANSLKGSLIGDQTIAQYVEPFVKQKADLIAERDKHIETEATFEYSDADRKLSKALAKALKAGNKALFLQAYEEFFDGYGLDITASFIEPFWNAMQGAGGQASLRTIAVALAMGDEVNFVAPRTPAQILKLHYAVLLNVLIVKAKFIKIDEVPVEKLKESYKKAIEAETKKRNKKAQKKAEKKAQAQA